MQFSSRFVVVVGLCAGAAVAQPPLTHKTKPVFVIGSEVATRHVSFADLNLAGANDRGVLMRRVKAAVSDVCDEAVGPSPIYYAKVGCWKSTWTKTEPQLTRAFQGARQISAAGADVTAAVITVQVPR